MDQAAAAQYSPRCRNQPAGSGQTAVAYATAVAGEPRGSELARQPSAMGSDQNGEAVKQPFRNYDAEISGEWTEPADSDYKSYPSNFGIICGKYSFDREDADRQQHIIGDIRDGPGQVFCFQEATDAFCQALKAPVSYTHLTLPTKRIV